MATPDRDLNTPKKSAFGSLNPLHRLCVAVALLLMAGCGNTVSTPGPVAPVPDEVEEANPFQADFQASNSARSALFDQRRDLDNTPEDTMPGSGIVTYSGVGSVAMDTTDNSFVALGDATVSINFGTAQVTGTMDNFIGRHVSGAEAQYLGALTMAGETGGAAFRDNRFVADVTGTLTSADQTIVVNSEMSGGFRGADHETLFGTSDDGDTVRLNGVATAGQVQFIGARQ